LQGVPEALMPQGTNLSASFGSEIAAEIAQLAKPRYHFAAGQVRTGMPASSFHRLVIVGVSGVSSSLSFLVVSAFSTLHINLGSGCLLLTKFNTLNWMLTHRKKCSWN